MKTINRLVNGADLTPEFRSLGELALDHRPAQPPRAKEEMRLLHLSTPRRRTCMLKGMILRYVMRDRTSVVVCGVLIACLGVLGCASGNRGMPQEYDSVDAATASSGRSLSSGGFRSPTVYGFAPPLPSGWSSDRVWRLILRKNLRSVAGLLKALHADDPRLLSRAVFMYDSKSLQHSTMRDPRTIVFSSDGSLMLAFGGDRSLKGYSTVELLDSKIGKGFEFREIHFPADGPEKHFGEDEIEETAAFAQLSRANPRECQMCHGSGKPLPIWNAYAAWPGAYGSNDDRLTVSEKENIDTHESYWLGHDRYQYVFKNLAPPEEEELKIAFWDNVDFHGTLVPPRWRYKRNNSLTGALSWVQAQNLVADVKRGRRSDLRLLASASACAPAGFHESLIRPFDDRIDSWYKESRYTPELVGMERLPGEIERGPGSRVYAIDSALRAFGLDIRNYGTIQGAGWNFHDGLQGFIGLDDLLAREGIPVRIPFRAGEGRDLGGATSACERVRRDLLRRMASKEERDSARPAAPPRPATRHSPNR